MIKFCHISPTAFLDKYTATNGAHIILAHLVQDDPVYRNFYANLSDGKPKIMDNSAFEMFKRGQPMLDPNILVDLGHLCKADYIVMSDYPKQHSSVTVQSAKKLIPLFKAAGFKTFFCPQSELGDMHDLINCIEWGLTNSEVDLIGLSILSCPIACGVNESVFEGGLRSDAYKMQRFLSRWKVFRELEKRHLLQKQAEKRFHCLGMVDGPNEIELLRPYHKFIFSWDSSAAVWAGLNGIRFDSSPTGLKHGKFEKEVDFSFKLGHDVMPVVYNINFINEMLRL